MSQEKMDRYKAAKANKEEIRKKQKKQKLFTRLGWTLGILVVLGLVAFGIYKSYPKDTPDTSSEVLTLDESTLESWLSEYNDDSLYATDSVVDLSESVIVETEAIESEAAESVETIVEGTDVAETEAAETEVVETVVEE